MSDAHNEGIGPSHQDRTEVARRVLQFDFSIELFDRNYRELRLFAEHIADPGVAFGVAALEDHWLQSEAMREVSYLLHNFVAAALSLVDHTRNTHRKLYRHAGALVGYPEEVQRRFASHPLSRFVIGLRTMAQHYRLPSIRLQQSFRGPATGGVFTVRLLLVTDDLRAFDGWHPIARSFLESAGESIDVLQLVTDYYQHVMEFHKWFRGEQSAFHGADVRAYAVMAKYGPHFAPRQLGVRLSANIGELERRENRTLSYDDLFVALAPALTICDQRLLLLCTHNARLWVDEALCALAKRVPNPESLRTRLYALLASAGGTE